MNELTYALITTNVATIAALIYFYRKSKQTKQTETVQLREFIANLMSGRAMLSISVINPEDLLLRNRRK